MRVHLAAIAALLALAWQCLVVQVHVHRPAAPAASEASVTRMAAVHDVPADDEPLTCALCRQLVQHGHYLGAAPVALAVLATIFAAAPVLPLRRHADGGRSHDWHSRGPPVSTTFQP